MDKYEFNIKVEQIKKMVSKGDYETAMKITDTIDWKRVRNTNLLSMVAEVYENNEVYQEAKDILLLAFERAPIGKRLLYKLAELALKENNVAEAEAYYREFCDLAQDDPRQHLLRYLILKAKGAPMEQLMHSLEGYTTLELEEKWLYELALLYQQAGREGDCIGICDKIMLMFGLGKYVDKAMELKLQYAPLTSYQMDLVENRDKYEAKLRAVEQQFNAPKSMIEHGDYYDSDMAEDEEEHIEKTFSPRARVRTLDEELEASMKEAEAEENLAREMSRISEDNIIMEENPAEQTRILTDIRAVMPTIEPSMMGGYPIQGEEPSVFQRPITLGEAMDGTDMGEESVWSESALTQEMPEMEEEPVVRKVFVSEEGHTIGQVQADQHELLEDDFLEIEELEDEPETYAVNNLMIEARTPEKGLQIALEVLRQIHKESGTKNTVIKITGSKLSKRGVFAVADKLAGKDLIVEEAGDLTQIVLDELNEYMDQDNSGTIVVLIDNPRQMEELHRQNPVLARKFECIGSGEEETTDAMADVEDAIQKQAEREERIARQAINMNPVVQRDPMKETHPEPQVRNVSPAREAAPIREAAPKREAVPVREIRVQEPIEAPMPPEPEYDDVEMDIDEFAQYACKYATEIDCSITGKSMLALYERIEIMEEDGIPLNRQNAEDLIEEAADRAEKPSIGKMITGVFSSKYNKDGLLILKEEHFID